MPSKRNGPARTQAATSRNRENPACGAKSGRTGTLRAAKLRKAWRFAEDAIGMMEGSRDLSARKGLSV